MQDHPRIRGKDLREESEKVNATGSPPHTRERRVAEEVLELGIRITPAYAGKTSPLWWKQHKDKDHPRIRGKDDVV